MRRILAIPAVAMMLLSVTIFGLPAGALKYNNNTSLAGVDASFRGSDPGSQAGYSVAVAGDVNGDGFADLVIGAPLDDTAATGAGKVFLVFGKSSGWAMDVNLTNADASFVGESSGANAGNSVSGAGDVNNDGFDDIVIGAYYANGNAGKAYIVFGRAGGWTKDASLSGANASFLGASGSRTGYTVAGAGDVNNDGFDDVVIGAPLHTTPMASGRMYLVFGRAGPWSVDAALDTYANASYVGLMNLHMGAFVDGAGDVNGDGFDDVIMSIGTSGGSGRTYLVLGRTAPWGLETALSNVNASFIDESTAMSLWGSPLSGAGDVNGDGLDDLAIGVYTEDDLGMATGKVYIVFGNGSGWSKDWSLTNANASYIGETGGTWTGYGLSEAGDVNGDGFDDLVVGASGYTNASKAGAGKAYLILGMPFGWAKNVNISQANASFIGVAAGEQAGYSVSGGGDLNGDGLSDIVVGANKNADGGAEAGKAYVIIPEQRSGPTAIASLKAYSNSACTAEKSKGITGDAVYIEAIGTDDNPALKGTTDVNVTSSSDMAGMRITLLETGLNTGIYRGLFHLMNSTDKFQFWIKTSPGGSVQASSALDPAKKASLYIGPLVMSPAKDVFFAQEDGAYSVQYSAPGWSGVSWTMSTNASWLQWNATTLKLTGTPDNSQVGRFSVKLNASSPNGFWDEHNFILTVNNSLPVILGTTDFEAFEDQPFSFDFNSTDDGQGSITWSLETDASGWLTLDAATGLLGGTPTNGDVGDHFVNISVADGNGGTDRLECLLTVENTNDAPVITTKDVLTANEDALYRVLYQAADVDIDDILSWTLDTDAGWLSKFDKLTGNLSGTPTNDDVGVYHVNITVSDSAGANDTHRFNLTVLNTNDPPIITKMPGNSTMKALENFTFNVTAADVDARDALAFSLDGAPSGMSIGPVNGTLTWTPSIAQAGNHIITVNVTDGHVWVTASFTILVNYTPPPPPPPPPVNHPPTIGALPNATAKVGSRFSCTVQVSDNDTGDVLTVSLVNPPEGVKISTGRVITWNPTKGQVGVHTITVKVTDGNLSATTSFSVTVSPKPDEPTWTDKNQPYLLILVVVLAAAVALMLFFKMRRQKV